MQSKKACMLCMMIRCRNWVLQQLPQISLQTNARPKWSRKCIESAENCRHYLVCPLIDGDYTYRHHTDRITTRTRTILVIHSLTRVNECENWFLHLINDVNLQVQSSEPSAEDIVGGGTGRRKNFQNGDNLSLEIDISDRHSFRWKCNTVWLDFYRHSYHW